MPLNIPFTVHNNINTRISSERTIYALITYYPQSSSGSNFDINQFMQSSFDDQEELVRQENINLKIPNFLINQDNIDQYKNQQCSICCSEYDIGDNVSKLNCDHLFHYNCIKEWGCYNQTCPLCKIGIPFEFI